MIVQTSSRQLVSGKLDWGWLQAVRIIIGTSFPTGCLILLGLLGIGKLDPLLQVANLPLGLGTACAMVLAFAFSSSTAREILANCRQNAPLSFSAGTKVKVTLYGLLLLAILAMEEDVTLSSTLLASWWAIAAMFLIGIATWLSMWITQTKTNAEQDLAAAEHLSVTTYSDRTVVVSPTSLSQQPRLFNGVMLMLMSVFLWTIVSLPERLKAIFTIIFAFYGLVSLTTWDLQFLPEQNLLRLCFRGLWGFAANYTIDLRWISRLEIIKLTEGDLTWVQLVGSNTEIALPSAVLTYTTKTDEIDELSQALLENCHLARHKTNRDSLSLMGILLPQGAVILAGTIFISLGFLALLLLPLTNKSLLNGLLLGIGCCLMSPKLARSILEIIAPKSLQPDPASETSQVRAWEIGAALIITVIAWQYHLGGIALTSLYLFGAWLSFGIGICLLSAIRRTPLISS